MCEIQIVNVHTASLTQFTQCSISVYCSDLNLILCIAVHIVVLNQIPV